MKKILLHILTLNMVSFTLQGQILNQESGREITLQDGVTLMVFSANTNPTHFYYLPKTIQLSMNKSVPEISLLLYQDSEKLITGGILHVLITWGLRTYQEKETQTFISDRIDSLGVLIGAAEINLVNGELVFEEHNIMAQELKKSSSTRIKVPTTSIHKTAASFNLTPLLARVLFEATTNEVSLKNVDMKSQFQYTISTGEKNSSFAEMAQGKMKASLSDWIQALKQYRQIKIISL